MSRKQFDVVRHLLQKYEWDYFQFVESGLDRIQHGFWQFHDPRHLLYKPGNPYENVIRDYYLYLDNEIGKIFDLVEDDTAILIVSGFGTERNDGGFCVNEWLRNEGLLVLNEYPREITRFDKLNVNWEKTKVWWQGSCCAGVFMNVKGREPQGIIEKGDYEKFRNEIKEKMEKTLKGKDGSLDNFVFKPEEIYAAVVNEAPDLIMCLGGLCLQLIDSIGHGTVYPQGKESGIEGCKHGRFGGFILGAPNNLLRGGVDGAHLLDIAPTLLELGGYEVPVSMQGKSLITGRTIEERTDSNSSGDEKEAIRQRLKGLGYI
jgi:predicted AlkP superfamily phosphohydrolase/phosphomutase